MRELIKTTHDLVGRVILSSSIITTGILTTSSGCIIAIISIQDSIVPSIPKGIETNIHVTNETSIPAYICLCIYVYIHYAILYKPPVIEQLQLHFANSI